MEEQTDGVTIPGHDPYDAQPGDAREPLDPACSPPGNEDTGLQTAGDELTDFWSCGPGFDEIEMTIEPPQRPHELLEKLGPSPFERGGFPVIGFLATTYDKVTRIVIERE